MNIITLASAFIIILLVFLSGAISILFTVFFSAFQFVVGGGDVVAFLRSYNRLLRSIVACLFFFLHTASTFQAHHCQFASFSRRNDNSNSHNIIKMCAILLVQSIFPFVCRSFSVVLAFQSRTVSFAFPKGIPFAFLLCAVRVAFQLNLLLSLFQLWNFVFISCGSCMFAHCHSFSYYAHFINNISSVARNGVEKILFVYCVKMCCCLSFIRFDLFTFFCLSHWTGARFFCIIFQTAVTKRRCTIHC